MLDATLPELNSPPLASTIDAAKARDVDAVGVQRKLGAWCVVTVRVHLPAILTRCSGAPAEESPLRFRKVRARCLRSLRPSRTQTHTIRRLTQVRSEKQILDV